MSRDALEALAASMRTPGDQTPIPLPLLIAHPPPLAGLTYFGQFLDHDLTCNATPLREAREREPQETLNGRTPWLDLDSLYGDGPGSTRHAHLYESDGALFRIGVPLFRDEPFDIPFTDTGEPAIADHRNAENLIVRQIHAMFLKLHNAAVRELPENLPTSERFERARERVRWQYQWLVRHCYLREICEPRVYRGVVEQGERCVDFAADGFSIPVEFAVAAMRFGHSMVRDAYILRKRSADHDGSGVVQFVELFGAQHRGPLHPRFKIDWAQFFEAPGRAMAIDTSIIAALFDLPGDRIDPYVATPSPNPPRSLAARTLLRGAAMRLPTGQQVRRHLQIPGELMDRPSAYDEDPWRHLRACGLADETPLFYYVLLEAQLEQTGQRLGTLGSRLVAEVIEGSLQLDQHSYLRQKPAGWKPEPWRLSNGDVIEITTLTELAIVAGV